METAAAAAAGSGGGGGGGAGAATADGVHLVRRCARLEEENAQLSAKLLRARRLVGRLEKERSFILGRLLQYEGWEASDSGTDTDSSDDDEEEEGIWASEGSSDSEQSSEEPPAKKAKRGSREEALAGESDGGLCVAVVKTRPCKSKALAGFKYCWHHAPLDPNSPFTWCRFVDAAKKKNKKCSIPVLKTKPVLYCKYHEQRMEEPLEGVEKASNTLTGLNQPNKHKAWSSRDKHGEPNNVEGEEVALMITEDDSDVDQ